MVPIPGLHLTEEDNRVVFAISAKGHAVTDPTVDETRMTKVPPSYYGLTKRQVDFFKKLQKTLNDASLNAINASCVTVQDVFGITDGGVAGARFSSDKVCGPIRRVIGEYMLLEVHRATQP